MKNKEVDKFKRLWLILEKIPKYPKYVTVNQIQKKLIDEGINVNNRTIQRDLNDLSSSGIWAITNEQNGKELRWSFIRESKLMSIPNMDIQTALSFRLTEKFMIKMMPKNCLKYIEPSFELSRETLIAKKDEYNNWVDKVDIIENTPLLAPKIDDYILELIYQSIINEKMIEVQKYQKYKQEYSFKANPLGIIFRDYTIYLICTTSIDNFKKVKYKPIHRFKEIKLTNNNIIIPENFDFKDFSKKELSWKVSEKKLNFEAEIAPEISFILFETPLSLCQGMTLLKNGNFHIHAKVEDTQQFRWWLLNLGNKIKVIKPKSLKLEFKNIAKSLYEMYFID